MSQPIIFATIFVSFFCIWMATHPAPPRSRRTDDREHRDADQESDDIGDQLRLIQQREAFSAHVRLTATGRNRWDRADLKMGIGIDSTLNEVSSLVWP